jgi:hypothetical protein
MRLNLMAGCRRSVTDRPIINLPAATAVGSNTHGIMTQQQTVVPTVKVDNLDQQMQVQYI